MRLAKCPKTSRGLNNLLHQVIHEGLQRHVIRENCLGALGWCTVGSCGVRGRRIQLGQQETGLGTACVTNDETRKRETVRD